MQTSTRKEGKSHWEIECCSHLRSLANALVREKDEKSKGKRAE
jgi:hypothetical protein